MNKKMVLSVVAVIVIVGAVVGAVLAHNNKPSNNMQNMSTSGSTSTNSSNNSTATNSVTIQNFAFSPADITVKVGTTVTWTNKDSVAHTVTETDGKTGPSSGTLENGKSYSFTYTAAGTYKYHCGIHSDMTGTVTVTN